MKGAVTVALAIAASTVAPAAAGGPAPVLTLAHAQPLVLSGTRFAARERVTLTVHARRVYLRRVATSTDGSFAAAFGVVPVARCAGLVAVAIGASGDRATLRIPRPACTA